MTPSPTISVIDDGSHHMGSLTAHRPLWASHGAGGSILSWMQHCLDRPIQGVAVCGQEDVLQPRADLCGPSDGLRPLDGTRSRFAARSR